MNPTYGEVSTTANLTNKLFCAFSLLEDFSGPYGYDALYGEVAVPTSFLKKEGVNKSLYTKIEYAGSCKPLFIRLKIEQPGGGTEYVFNELNRNNWFGLQDGIREEERTLHISELRSINENGNFHLLFKGSYLAVFSADETDFIITPSLRQNEAFLLKAFAGNIYQYPTTGVGLIEFLHGNFENSGLAAKLQSEFENDRMQINNAYMNSATGELYLEVEEKNG